MLSGSNPVSRTNYEKAPRNGRFFHVYMGFSWLLPCLYRLIFACNGYILPLAETQNANDKMPMPG